MVDLYLELKIVQEARPIFPPPLPSLVETAFRWKNLRYQSACRRCETQARLLVARLERHYLPTNFFDLRDILEIFARLTNTIEGEIVMATKSKKQPAFERAEWKGFLDVRLTDAQLEEADAWKCSPLQMLEGVHVLAMEGYKLTVSYSAQAGCSTATLMAGTQQGTASGYAVSARGENSADALKLLLFKHHFVLERDWTKLLTQPPAKKRG